MVGAWHGHGMASVNQTRPHCVNQMGKTQCKRQGKCMGAACYVRIGLIISLFMIHILTGRHVYWADSVISD